VPALCVSAWVVVADDWTLQPYMAGIFGLAFLIALAHALVLGAPYVALLRLRGWFGFLQMLVGGFIAGLLPFALLSIAGLTGRGNASVFEFLWTRHQDLLLCATLGATGALAFYGAFRAAQPATS
jgi:hypothetical protein